MGRHVECWSCGYTLVFDTFTNRCNRCGNTKRYKPESTNEEKQQTYTCYICKKEGLALTWVTETEEGFACDDCLHEDEQIPEEILEQEYEVTHGEEKELYTCKDCDCSYPVEAMKYPRVCLDCFSNGDYADEEVAIKYDSGKPRYDLIPTEVLDAYATILAFGAKKYSDRNWQRGFTYGRVFGALMRHMWAWWKCEDNDPESGFSHLWHAIFNVAALIYFESKGVGQDDRVL